MKNKKLKIFLKINKVEKNLLFPSKPCYDAFLKHSKLSAFFIFKKFFHFLICFLKKWAFSTTFVTYF